MAIPALALGMLLRTIAKEGVKGAVKKYGKQKVKEAQQAAKSPEVRKKAEEAVKERIKKNEDLKSRAISKEDLPEGMQVVNNTLLNKGGMPTKANCGASVPPNRKAKS